MNISTKTVASDATAAQVAASDPSAQTERTARGKVPRRRAMVIAAAVVAVLVAGWIVAFSPVLGVRTVAVRGAGFVTDAQIRSAAGVKHGTPLLRLDTAPIVRRIDALVGVRSATVTKSYPNTVTITVVERVAVGFLDAGGGSFALVDAEGVRFRTLTQRPPRLPLLVVPAGAQATASAAAVATVAGDLPAAVLARVQSIQAFDPSAITLLLTDSRVVRWGGVERSADKARVLPALLQQPGTQFDVSDPDEVIAR